MTITLAGPSEMITTVLVPSSLPTVEVMSVGVVFSGWATITVVDVPTQVVSPTEGEASSGLVSVVNAMAPRPCAEELDSMPVLCVLESPLA